MNLMTGTAYALLSVQIHRRRLHYRDFDTATTAENFVCWFHISYLGWNGTAATSLHRVLVSRNLPGCLLCLGLAGAPIDTLCQHHLHDSVANLIVVGVTARMLLQTKVLGIERLFVDATELFGPQVPKPVAP